MEEVYIKEIGANLVGYKYSLIGKINQMIREVGYSTLNEAKKMCDFYSHYNKNEKFIVVYGKESKIVYVANPAKKQGSKKYYRVIVKNGKKVREYYAK